MTFSLMGSLGIHGKGIPQGFPHSLTLIPFPVLDVSITCRLSQSTSSPPRRKLRTVKSTLRCRRAGSFHVLYAPLWDTTRGAAQHYGLFAQASGSLNH